MISTAALACIVSISFARLISNKQRPSKMIDNLVVLIACLHRVHLLRPALHLLQNLLDGQLPRVYPRHLRME